MKDKLIEALVGLINAIAALFKVASLLSLGILATVMTLALTDRLEPDKLFEIALLVFGFYFSAKAYSKAYDEGIARATRENDYQTAALDTNAAIDEPVLIETTPRADDDADDV